MKIFQKPGFRFAFGMSLVMTTYAPSQDLKFQRLSIEDGLSQSTVYIIFQDSRGFMWFGTEDGLKQYDGYSFIVHKHHPTDSTSLSANHIYAICEDHNGDLWIGTKEGLNRFDRATAKFTGFLHDPNDPHSLSFNNVWAVWASRQKGKETLWVGTHGGGLCRLRLADRAGTVSKTAATQFTRFKNDPQNSQSLSHDTVIALHEDSRKGGTLWIGTLGGGLNRFDPVTETFTSYRHDPTDPQSLSSDNVVAINEDETGTLWIGTYGGGLCRMDWDESHTPIFVRYQNDPRDPASLPHNTVHTILTARQNEAGTLWIGTFGGGLCRVNRDDRVSGKFAVYKHDVKDPATLSHDRVSALAEDRAGNLWIGTWTGLNKVSPQSRKFAHIQHDPTNPNSLSQKFVNAIWEDRAGDLWVGTENGVDRFAAKTPSVEHFRHEPKNQNSLSHYYIKALSEDSAGAIWIGAFGGGISRRFPDGRFKHYRHHPAQAASLNSNFVTAFHNDSAGNMWIGTNKGLARFEFENETFVRYQNDLRQPNSLSDINVACLGEDRKGNLWIGTYLGGVNRFDPQTGQFTRFQHDPQNANSLSHNGVTSIYADRDGLLWFGTAEGLNKFDPRTGAFTRYNEKDGLPNAFIYGILGDDEGNLWLSTNNGLSKCNDRLPPGRKFKNYDVTDGLQSDEFNVGAYHRGRSGAFYFGGINGLNRFFPGEVRENPHAPPIALTAFKKFNEIAALDTALAEIKTLKLSYRENFFSFDFAALDYTQPEKNRYAYKMEGFDQDWIYSETRRYVSYTNLEAGKYVFRVKGANSDGVWNEKGAAVNVIITPPFWKTWWFRALAATAIIGLLGLIYRYRVERLLEMERLRVRIASDLHDDIGATLTKISLHSELIQDGACSPEVLTSLRKIGAMSRELVTTMSDVVWSIDARNDTVGNLLDRMREFAASVLAAKSVAFNFNTNGLELNKRLPVDLRQNLYLIFKEAINNVAKHADATRVEIQLENGDSVFKMAIHDDGHVLAETEKQTGHGLRNMKMRAQRIGGELEILRNGGYIVSLTAPALR